MGEPEGVDMGGSRQRTAGLLVGAIVLAGSACSAEVTKPSELSDDPSTSVSRPSPDDAAEKQAVIDQYKGFFGVLTDLTSWDESSLEMAFGSFATGKALENMIGVAQSLAASQHRAAGSVVFSPLSVTFQQGQAVVTECRDASSETVVDLATGSVVSTGTPGTKIEAHLVQSGGAWKVSEYAWEDSAC